MSLNQCHKSDKDVCSIRFLMSILKLYGGQMCSSEGTSHQAVTVGFPRNPKPGIQLESRRTNSVLERTVRSVIGSPISHEQLDTAIHS